MSTTAIFFILYALTGEATLTPIGQYDSKEACAVVENVMNAAVGSNAIENAKFKCFDAQTMLEMFSKNGIEIN
ncbi:MAG: hypothetical protein J0I48_04435 [Devosia sp.]|jgi:hypothetical protein|uniref:hypothetical protein n=1 Tax=unclassified Devosia TaxID=196773 RepID=UPI000929B596|nr:MULTISPECIES: hypothetical protein [unclassified Devosia]MBL8598771.1 hypothetical protein [Devosia sp.]MBN9345441.1 hypothetical protein [Devosia sp.]OJX48617.1 MAG: hypothetical protein BGO81_18165 [Devosia sp. 66-22]